VLLGIVAGCGASEADARFSPTGGTGTGGAGTSGGGAPPVVARLQARAVAVGASHSCALLDGGGVACWGDGSRGQLGDGVAGHGYHRPFAVKVPGLSHVAVLRAGGDTTCVLLESGRVLCWGDGAHGQLGDGHAADDYFQAAPVAVEGLSGAISTDPLASPAPGAVDLSVSPSGACAALSDGTVRCWGSNSAQGWLGFTSADCGPYSGMENGAVVLLAQPCEKSPRWVPGVAGARRVVAGGEATCAVTMGGGVTCWGADTFGQLGDGFSGPGPHDPSPGPVFGVGKTSNLALGTSHTCAVSGDQGRLSCWGDNSFGQLGIGSTALDSNRSKPTPVPGVDAAFAVAAAADVTCVVLDDHTVQCWGHASYLLAPAATPAAAPDTPSATLVPGVTEAVEVSISGSHACVLRENATVVCWGLNDQGQIGNGTMGLGDDSLLPVAAPP
jgi:alpha-tubulin suppressor-like RCC1 family protein